MGYFAIIAVGVTLGLMGGGGSILTVPVLVYLFGIPALTAASDSLFLVGITSAVGAAIRARQGLVSWRAAFLFSVPSIASVWLTRTFLLARVPERLGPVSRDTMMLLLLACLILATAFSMLRGNVADENVANTGRAEDVTWKPLVGSAILVGLVTGLVGAGGGFLIVPALALGSKLPIRRATSTSLVIVATNSLTGFLVDGRAAAMANGPFLMIAAALAIAGMALGIRLSRHIPGTALRPAFAVFLLVVGAYSIVREIFSML